MEDLKQREQSNQYWGSEDLKELNELKYERPVQKGLDHHRKKEKDLIIEKKSAEWKIEMARDLRGQSSAPNPWIARRWNTGELRNVSQNALLYDQKIILIPKYPIVPPVVYVLQDTSRRCREIPPDRFPNRTESSLEDPRGIE